MRFRRVAGVSLLSNPHGIHPQSRLVFLVGMNWNRDRHNYFSRGHVDVVHVICTFSPAPFHMSRKMWLQGAVVFVPQLLLVWASQQDGAELHFSASGQFKIAQFADCKKWVCMHQLCTFNYQMVVFCLSAFWWSWEHTLGPSTRQGTLHIKPASYTYDLAYLVAD